MTEIKEPLDTSIEEEGKYHSYSTHKIPWFVRAAWICFWIGCVWYVVKYAIPMAKNYF